MVMRICFNIGGILTGLTDLVPFSANKPYGLDRYKRPISPCGSSRKEQQQNSRSGHEVRTLMVSLRTVAPLRLFSARVEPRGRDGRAQG
jgi:hypothetical protein